MRYKLFLLLFLVSILALGCTKSNNKITGNIILDEVILYKSESCGCCDFYKTYLEKQGFNNVNTIDVDNTFSIKDKYNIPANLQSCHTTIIGDYFIEGHIPIEAIEKLLEEKPDIAGIAMPGMPSGSPGMLGGKYGLFRIYAILKDNSYNIFMDI